MSWINENLDKPQVRFGFAEFTFDASSKILRRDAETVSLAPKASELLAVLIENAPRVLSREELMNRVWNDSFVEEANLTHHISALRKALGEDKNGKKFIETIPRKGYRFVAPITEANERTAEIIVSERTTVTEIVVEEEIEFDETPPPENIAPAKLILPPKPEEKSRRQWQRLLLPLMIAVALIVVGFGVYKFVDPAPMVFEAKKMTRLTVTGKVSLAAVSPDGKIIAYAQDESGGRQSLWLRHLGSDSSVQIASPSNVEYRGLSISPDGNSLYYVVGNGTLYRMPALGGAAKKIADGLYTGGGGNVAVGIAPDGKQIAYVRRFEKDASALFLVNADGGGARQFAAFEQPVRLSASVVWSPDGKIIACRKITAGGHNILAVRVADGASAPILPRDWNAAIRQTAWMPDSKSLLMIAGENMYQIAYPGGEARQINVSSDQRVGIGLTADGRMLATVKSEIAAYIWTIPDSDANRARQITAGFEKTDGVYGINWTTDGKIVYDSGLSGEHSIWSGTTNGGISRQLLKDGGSPAVAPDNRFFVYQKGTEAGDEAGLRLVNLSDASEKRLTSSADAWQTFSPDGKWLVFTRYAERVGLWKMPSGGDEPTLILDENAICPAISPDGKTIAFILRRAGEANRIALVPMDGGGVIKTFDARLERTFVSDNQHLQWTADGRGIYYVALNDDVSNVWQQPLDGGAPVPVTNFKDGRIFNFAFSADGSQLALSRGSINSDVVLIENAE